MIQLTVKTNYPQPLYVKNAKHMQYLCCINTFQTVRQYKFYLHIQTHTHTHKYTYNIQISHSPTQNYIVI